MKISKTIEDKENFLINRREIKFIVESEKNPGFDETINLIAEHFKSEKDNLEVKQIKGKFGRDTFLVSVFIYKSKEDKEKFERKKEKKAAPGAVASTQPALAAK